MVRLHTRYLSSGQASETFDCLSYAKREVDRICGIIDSFYCATQYGRGHVTVENFLSNNGNDVTRLTIPGDGIKTMVRVVVVFTIIEES